MPGKDGAGPPWWHGRLSGCGYRVTLPRQLILGVLSKSRSHLSAEDVYIAVHRLQPSVGLTTVYRTLDLLVKMGLVFKFDFGDGRARYELAEGQGGKGHHHHLVCTSCGRIVDYTDYIEEEMELLKKAEAGLSKKFNFNISDHMIQFSGVCGDCRG